MVLGRGARKPLKCVGLLVLFIWFLAFPSGVRAFQARNPVGKMQFLSKISLLQPSARTMQVRFARRAAEAAAATVTSSNAAGKKKRVLVVVESPTKAVTIGKYLANQPKTYVVQSTMGHLRDLKAPAK